jgi:preprotein translocase subunit SecA
LVKRFSDLLPKTRRDYYALVAILIMILTLWVGKETLDKTESAPAPPTEAQVQQIVDDTLKDQGTAPTPIRAEKIGRNEQCPCGSGKKYKFCHGAS